VAIMSKKGEWRSRAEESVLDIARSERTSRNELVDITFSGEWGTTDYGPGAYDKAITPFSMIATDSELRRRIIRRKREHDEMAAHKSAPSASEATVEPSKQTMFISFKLSKTWIGL
jgi:hypothetical protein